MNQSWHLNDILTHLSLQWSGKSWLDSKNLYVFHYLWLLGLNLTVMNTNSCSLDCSHGSDVFLDSWPGSSTHLQDQSVIVWQLCANSSIDLSAVNNTSSCQDDFKETNGTDVPTGGLCSFSCLLALISSNFFWSDVTLSPPSLISAVSSNPDLISHDLIFSYFTSCLISFLCLHNVSPVSSHLSFLSSPSLSPIPTLSSCHPRHTIAQQFNFNSRNQSLSGSELCSCRGGIITHWSEMLPVWTSCVGHNFEVKACQSGIRCLCGTTAEWCMKSAFQIRMFLLSAFTVSHVRKQVSFSVASTILQTILDWIISLMSETANNQLYR